MLQFEGKKSPQSCESLSRRDFLRVGALSAGAVGLTLADTVAAENASDVNCILLFLVGGPSQIDTWDMKPNAPSDYRGPFRPTHTNVPGIDICEHFPQMAKLAHHYSIVRTVHHDEAPIHETGQQLLQTGTLANDGQEYPHYGAVLSSRKGSRSVLPPNVVLPAPFGNTGVSVGHGQSAGTLGEIHAPFVLEGDPARPRTARDLCEIVDRAHRRYDSIEATLTHAERDALRTLFASQAKEAFDLSHEEDMLRESYGRNTFGQSCLLARRLVERGTRFVTVNMFDTVFNEITWDCHADGGALPSTLDDYQETLCPTFDRAYSSLIEDLHQRGMLESTLVLAMGEFGRTPKMNPRGGRDHWPSCWSVLFAGAGVRGGQLVGTSDQTASEPADRPVSPAEIAASVYHGLGVNPTPRLPGLDEPTMSPTDAEVIAELF